MKLLFSLSATVDIALEKKNQPLKLKPKPKHPIKVHVWGAISKHGAIEVYIFEGKMDAAFYIQILESNLVPFTLSW